VTPSTFQLDRRWQQLRKLTEVSRALTYAVTLDDVLNLAVERAAELLGADRAVLMLTNEEGLLSVRASHGLDQAACEPFREPLAETLITRLQGLLGAQNKEAFLGVPLVVGGEVTGLLAIARPDAEGSVEEQEWLLSALADQAAVALEKTRLDETAVFRERLLGIVSHDLRNPIAAVVMAADLLLHRNELDDRSTKVVVRIRSSAKRANRMLEDLLDFTQSRLGGGLRVQRKPADLHAIVAQVVDETSLAHPERQIDVVQNGHSRGAWDPDRLAQVVGNLVANAVAYSPLGTAIGLETFDHDDGVTLRIRNEGPPIPAERLPHVFEPMQRATADVPKSTRSVGLGLYIVKEIVEAHGGSVSVESSEGVGTTFTVWLPRGARD
jgi:phosphoserine phosphatase RsbU/P